MLRSDHERRLRSLAVNDEVDVASLSMCRWMQTSFLMFAVGPVSCLTRVVSASPRVAIAVGYDIDEPLEGPVNRAIRTIGAVGSSESPCPHDA
jgi:hypothetical protein